MAAYGFYRMANKVNQMVVCRMFARSVGDLADKGDILLDMCRDINRPLHFVIVVAECSVGSEEALPHRLFQAKRKKIREKVPDALAFRGSRQIKHVDAEHLLEHVMQKVLLPIRIKSRMDMDIDPMLSAEANNVPCLQRLFIEGKNRQTVDVISVVTQTTGKHQQFWMRINQFAERPIPDFFQHRTLNICQVIRQDGRAVITERWYWHRIASFRRMLPRISSSTCQHPEVPGHIPPEGA